MEKAPDTGQDVTAGRSPHRPLLPDTVGPAPPEPTSLWGLANKARADQPPRFRELSRGREAHLLRACGEDLHTAAARGVAQGTAQAAAVNLQANREAWAPRLQAHRYRATLGRRCSMPKANGPARPVGRPARDDQLVPRAGATLCTAIDAQDCLEGRYGDRPGRGAREAVRALPCARPYGRYGYLGAAAIPGCCDPRAPAWRLARRRVRIDDRAVLQRSRPW